jgi:hypothetical protein
MSIEEDYPRNASQDESSHGEDSDASKNQNNENFSC